MKFLNLRGARLPVLGFGTWQLEGDACIQGVRKDGLSKVGVTLYC